MDALTTVLQTIRIQDAQYCRIEATAPWGVKDTGDVAVFNLLLQGECYLEIEGVSERIHLKSGDSCLILPGHPYIARDHPYTRPELAEDIMRKYPIDNHHVLAQGGGGSPMVTLSIRFRFGDMQTNPLLSALPPFLLVRGEVQNLLSRVQPLFHYIADEIFASQPGAESVISRLTEALFTQMIYTYVKALPEGTGRWLNGLSDPLIAPVLGLIHQHPERSWKVADLAASVQLSSSAFSARFSVVVGESPLQYLTRWRMQKAASLLRENQASVKEVAELVGYESEASLSNTFKKWMGVWPGAYRRSTTTIARLVEVPVLNKQGAIESSALAFSSSH